MMFDVWAKDREDKNNEVYKDNKGKVQLIIKTDVQNPDRPKLIAWVGKAKKPRYNYYFRTLEYFNKYKQDIIEEVIERANKRIDEKEQDKRIKKEHKIQTKLGDIFHHSFGYNMTINEFYQVTAIKGRKVELTELNIDYDTTGFLTYRVKPIVNSFVTDKEGNKKVVNKILQICTYNPDKPREYVSFDNGYYKLYNVTEAVKRGETWYENRCD